MKNVCGLDVHKDSIFMCIIKKNGDKVEEKFGVLTPELDRLRDLLVIILPKSWTTCTVQ